MKRIFARAMLLLTAVFSLVSGCRCHQIDPEDIKYERVLIYYAAGFNSLRDYIYEDIQDLKSGYAPSKKDKKAFLVIEHLSDARGNYSVQTSPQLIQVYSDGKKGVVLDTIKTYGGDLSEGENMKTILSDIKRQFQSDHYGMVFSSHASGWLPAGYFYHPESFETYKSASGRKGAAAFQGFPSGTFPRVDEELLPGEPLTKSLTRTDGVSTFKEMDLKVFKDNIPMHLDYILMDACLMGCIEVAYELKDICDQIGFSQAEILADGFNYKTLAGDLLGKSEPDTRAVVDDYFQQYASKADKTDRSATISLVDCTKLDALASVCRPLFSKYSAQMAELDPFYIQRYYRNSKHWFYDLEDILLQAGIDAGERASLTSALNSCIIYKAATDEFLKGFGGFTIRTFCGFSMYFPYYGSAFLDSKYKELAWNKATGLVD